MKCNQSRPGFELVSPCPFPATITITPRAPPKMFTLPAQKRCNNQPPITIYTLKLQIQDNLKKSTRKQKSSIPIQPKRLTLSHYEHPQVSPVNISNILVLSIIISTILSHYCIIKIKLATLVKGNPKAPFLIATTPRCKGGCYSIPLIVPLYP